MQLVARLDAWPVQARGFDLRDETQVAITWRLRLALQDGDLERASAAHTLLQAKFGKDVRVVYKHKVIPEQAPGSLDASIDGIMDQSAQCYVEVVGL